MSVTLEKATDPTPVVFDPSYGSYDLVNYLHTIFGPTYTYEVMQDLNNNDLRGLSLMLILEHRYDNTTGELI